MVLLNLPCSTRGLTLKHKDDTYTIILNSRLSFEQQRKTYLHELLHIENDDFAKIDVNVIENNIREAR